MPTRVRPAGCLGNVFAYEAPVNTFGGTHLSTPEVP